MSHWLEEEIKRLKEKELNLDKEKVRQNYTENKSIIDDFFHQLVSSFEDLGKVMARDFKFTYRFYSAEQICDCEFAEFSAINFTQKPAFLRRLEFLIPEAKGKIRIQLFRGKHSDPEEPWQFHDKQQFDLDIEKLKRELVLELIDWFAWKSYSPRGIR
jgi:hypothetical protein